jgi:hypothetical protein
VTWTVELCETAAWRDATSAPTLRDLLVTWGMAEEWAAFNRDNGAADTMTEASHPDPDHRPNDSQGEFYGRVRFVRRYYPGAQSPKQVLFEHFRHAGDGAIDLNERLNRP